MLLLLSFLDVEGIEIENLDSLALYISSEKKTYVLMFKMKYLGIESEDFRISIQRGTACCLYCTTYTSKCSFTYFRAKVSSVIQLLHLL